MQKSLSLAKLALALTALLALPARAQETADPVAADEEAGETSLNGEEAAATAATSEYEVALSEALAAHARGDYAQAHIFMEKAHALSPSARTLRGLGIVAFAQGRHQEAIRHLDAALASREKALTPELRASVEELLTHAWGQVGRYEILVDPATGDFMIDGHPPELYAPNVVVLRPGNHLLTVRAPARAPYELSLVVKPGEQRVLHIVLAVPPAPIVVAAAESPSSSARHAAPSPFWNPKTRWITLGSGGALVAAGAITWAIARTRLKRLVHDCEDHVDGTCTVREATGLYRGDNIEGLGITAGVLAGVGALTLVTAGGIELWRRQRRRDEGRALSLALHPDALVLTGRF